MAKSNEVFAFKILIIGESSVGKSSLMTRFVDDTFQAGFLPTIGVDFKVRTLIIDGHPCKIQIWDTAGQERFRVITTTYYRDASGVMIVYDVTNGETFASVRRWIQELSKYCDQTIPKVLVGNKDDTITIDNKPVRKDISTAEAERFANDMHLPFFETSAKDNKNVSEAFEAMARLVLQQRIAARNNQNDTQPKSITNSSVPLQTVRLDGSKKKDKKTPAACCK